MGGAAITLAGEALVLVPMTLKVDHLRFLNNNHSRPIAATISTTMMLHGVDGDAASLCFFALP